MALLENIKKGAFWVNVFKVGFVFLIIITIISLLIYSVKDIFSGNLNAVIETNFSNGQWKRFFASKALASTIYGIYVSNKNMP